MEVNKKVVGCIYRTKNCKNHFKIVGQIILKKNDVATDVAQHKNNSIKHYASTFSNI